MWSMVDVRCPYCGETVAVAVDASEGGYDTIEDCAVCCRPMRVSVAAGDEDGITVSVQADHEA